MDEELDPAIVLKSWRLLYKHINELSELQLKTLINYEVATSARPSFLSKMHQRYCKVRNARERTTLIQRRMI